MVAVGLISVIAALTVGAVAYAAVVTARHQAQAAADLSALAAAGALASGRDAACARAAEIASAMRSRLLQCRPDNLDIVVTVDIAVALRIPMGTARASARAGPVASIGSGAAG